MHMEYFSQLILMLILVIAAISDIRFQKIPNWLTFPTMIGAIIYNTSSMGVSGFLFSSGGIFVGIAVMSLPYLMGGMGAGDAKLMGAVGGLLGPKGIFIAFLLTALIGGIYAMIVLTLYGSLRETLRRYWLLLKTFFLARKLIYIPPSEHEKKPRLRYGVAIALGTIIAMVIKNTLYSMLNFL
ncbi:MAG: flp pilus assembly protein protease [Nitrospirae bacterium]|nr:flp pilus assembly protein protease [Nitrospirota bacterium]